MKGLETRFKKVGTRFLVQGLFRDTIKECPPPTKTGAGDDVKIDGGYMKVVLFDELQKAPGRHYAEAAQTLKDGGLVSFPSPSGYKLAADMSSGRAVSGLLQAKRRVKNAPALVFVPKRQWVETVADAVSEYALALMDAFWPGPVTLLFEPHPDLDSKVKKALTKAKGWLGVRMPGDDVALGVLGAFDGPILVSSANLAQRHGECSVAQVKKNFGRTVELLIDAGDLPQGPKSTLVDVSRGQCEIVREDAVASADIRKAISSLMAPRAADG